VQKEAELVIIANAAGGLLEESLARAIVGRHAWERGQAAGLWLQVVPGWFRHAATPLTFEMKVCAGSAWLGRRGALFADSGLRWLGVEVPEPEAVGFLVPRERRSIPNWMTLHTTGRWDQRDVIRHRGVRTCTATRAIIDLATQTRSARRLEDAIDSAIRLRRTALSRLQKRLQGLSGTGRHGCRLLRELLLDSGGESFLERRFLRLVRGHGLPRPECQVVYRAGGATIARVDFRFPEAHLVVEVSGRLGHTSDRERQKDARRRNHLQQAGEKVIEFTTVDVIDDPAYVLATLRTSLRVAA
jgi:hypothetical protein